MINHQATLTLVTSRGLISERVEPRRFCFPTLDSTQFTWYILVRCTYTGTWCVSSTEPRHTIVPGTYSYVYHIIRVLIVHLRRAAFVLVSDNRQVVLNNFGDKNAPSHVRLMKVTLQNMFPSINVATVKLQDCRRVVMFNLDKTKGTVEMRHFAVRATPTGIAKAIKKVHTSRVHSAYVS